MFAWNTLHSANNMVSKEQPRMERRRVDKSKFLITWFPSAFICIHLYLWSSNLVPIHYCFVHHAWVPWYPPGNNPMPGLVCGWLCWELKILWKCYQPVFIYSLVSTPNKELSLFQDVSEKMFEITSCEFNTTIWYKESMWTRPHSIWTRAGYLARHASFSSFSDHGA